MVAPRAIAAAGCRAAGPPTAKRAWRAAPIRHPSVFDGIPGKGGRRIGSLGGPDASWLLVLGTASTGDGACWVRVRLPGRPNDEAGWVAAGRLLLARTPWRLEVSTSRRTLSVLRAGRLIRRFAVVVGASATPTPHGLFSIVHAWRGDPSSFVGSWVLGLTAHSDVLRHFEGGSGEVGIHGRGGGSLLDPLGTAASHGCIRLANRAIDWLVRTIGPRRLPGIPVLVGS
ncbi:MAG: L,D-transpeptidase [Actinobacteria bacterium]|nr:L,D-transpeptidase [Actinomycetota bacterium]